VNRDRLLELLRAVSEGRIAPADALHDLAQPPVEELPFATIDHHRAIRHGYPEVVLASGKTVEQVVAIAQRIAQRGDGVLVTRADEATRSALSGSLQGMEINALGRTAYLPGNMPAPQGKGAILIVTAGTSDLPVAEEAAATAKALGNCVERLTDVGVSGIHRVLARADALQRAAVVVVVAGMEGALPSVIGGLVSTPVIAVPTSVGYGASFGGIAALLGMLNSCASGVTVVNIDNGFGAAFAASRITHRD
jgi:NCAIR mutase (PurE)-related protein